MNAPTILIACASAGGRTAETAAIAAEAAGKAGALVTGPMDVRGRDATLLRGHDGVLLGEPTWGQGTHLPEFEPFAQSMRELCEPGGLAGVRAAAFTGCDRAYANFGRALVLLEGLLLDCGAELVQRGLMIELAHNQHSREHTRRWAEDFVARLRGELAQQPYLPRMTRADVDAVMGISAAERIRRETGGLGG